MGGFGTVIKQPGMLPQSNRVIRNPMRDRQRKEVLEDTCYIFNITPTTWSPIYRTHSTTLIFGNEAIDRVPEELLGKRFGFETLDSVPYSWTKIHGVIELVENGIESSRGVSYDEVPTEAALIADDIVNFCNENRPPTESGVPGYGGVFWSAHPKPMVKELKDAQKRLFAYYKALVEDGDRIHSDGVYNPNPLKDRPETMMKVAFRTLKSAGILSGDKPWVFDPTPPPASERCPACGGSVPQKALRCNSCHAFLSTDKALLRKYFPGEFAEPPAQTK